MQLLYRTLSKSKSIFMHNKSLSPNPTCKSQFLNILTYAQMIYNSISLTSANHKKSQTSFTDSLNARVTALLVMKRCISYRVLFSLLKRKRLAINVTPPRYLSKELLDLYDLLM